MALSFFFQQNQPDLAAHFFGSDYDMLFSELSIDPLFETNNFSDSFYSDNYSYLLPNFPHETYFPPNYDLELEPSCFYPKRQKRFENHSQFNSFSSNPSSNQAPLMAPTLPELSRINYNNFPPQIYDYGNPEFSTCTKKPSNSTSTTLSVQSLAARERRRKITEKTQELGKLIPGGSRMNTAEMFQAAAKYVKFLQAQTSILQHISSIKKVKEELLEMKELQVLGSPIVQEKLYSEEKCLVPKEFVETLAKENDMRLKPFLKDISELMENNGGR
ncbi:hypothetical protein UlMin_019526 [Ulmus minor]